MQRVVVVFGLVPTFQESDLDRLIDSARRVVNGELFFEGNSFHLFGRHRAKRRRAGARPDLRGTLTALGDDVRFDRALLHANSRNGKRDLQDAFARRRIGSTNEKRRDRRWLSWSAIRILVRRRTRNQLAEQLITPPQR